MSKNNLLILILASSVLVGVVNCSFVSSAHAGEYLEGYTYPPIPKPEVVPDLTVEVCQPLSALQAREAYFDRLWFFAHELSIEHTLEEQRLEYLDADRKAKSLAETTEVE
jgi:hypothetical protein